MVLLVLFAVLAKTQIFADVVSSNIKIYVSNSGNDTWSGKIAQVNSQGTDGPLKSIERARDKVRQMKQAGQINAPVNIEIEEGVYELSQTLELNNSDSGTADYPITYESYGGQAIISGGQKLSASWTKCSNSDPKCVGLPTNSIDNTYYASVGDKAFNSLFVNGARATRARTPNDGQDTGNRGPSGNVIGAGFYNIAGCKSGEVFKDHFLFRAGDINPNWKNLTDVETVLLTRWRTSRYKILSVDGNRVKIAGQAINSLDTDYCQDVSLPGTRYYLDNVFEGLDTADEWYLDKNAHNLFYYPKQGEDITTSKFAIPKLQQLINISGSSQTAPVTNINFKNLIFENTDWSLPNDPSDPTLQGSWDIQSLAPVKPTNQDIYKLNYPSAPAIFLNSTNDVVLSNNIFSNLGGHALQAYHTSNLSVKSNEFKNLGMDGVVFGDTTKNELEKPETLPISSGGFSIVNNIIHDYGQVNPSGVGVLGLLAKDSKVEKNHIYNGGYDGIQIGWDWHDLDNGANRIKVEKNLVHNVCRVFNDGAGIYMVGTHLESSMSNNLVHNVERTTSQLYNYNPIGLYLDNHSSGVTQENNIAFNNNMNLNYNGNSRDIFVRNNISVSFKDEMSVTIGKPLGTFNFSNNIIYTGSDKTYMRVWSPTCVTKDNTTTCDYSNFSMNDNLYYLSAGAFKFGLVNIHALTGMSDFKEITGLDANSIEADPQFNDPNSFNPNNTSDFLKRDYSLKSTSPALTLGFKQIDTSGLGPQGKVGPDNIKTKAIASPASSPVSCLNTVSVPDSIDSTGATDVSGALKSFFASVPDNSKIVFKAGGVYRIDSALRIEGRHHLTFDGNGATIRYGGTSDGTKTSYSIFTLVGTTASPASNITIENFKLFGNSTSPGSYIKGQEYQMGFLISGVKNVDIHNNEITGVWGDAFYLSGWAETIDIYNNHVFSAGRNGGSIVAARNINFWNNNFDLVSNGFDLEPNLASEGAENIKIINNTVDRYYDGLNSYFIAANGVPGASMNNLTVSGNTVVNSTLHTVVNNHTNTRRQNIVFTNNASKTVTPEFLFPDNAVLRFVDIDNLMVFGNTQPLQNGMKYLEFHENCTNIISEPPAGYSVQVPTPTANPGGTNCTSPVPSPAASPSLTSTPSPIPSAQPSPSVTMSAVPQISYTFPHGFSVLGVTTSIPSSTLTMTGLYIYYFDTRSNQWLVAPNQALTLDPGKGYYVFNKNNPITVSLPIATTNIKTFDLVKGWNLLFSSSGTSRKYLKVNIDGQEESVDDKVNKGRVNDRIYIINDASSANACSYFNLLATAEGDESCNSTTMHKTTAIPAGKAFWVYVK